MSKMRLLPVCFIKDEDEESEGEKPVFPIDGKENNDTIIKRGQLGGEVARIVYLGEKELKEIGIDNIEELWAAS